MFLLALDQEGLQDNVLEEAHQYSVMLCTAGCRYYAAPRRRLSLHIHHIYTQTAAMTDELLGQSFVSARADLVHECVDGEVVIVNLANGKYYSLEGAGADFWQLLITALPLAEVIDHFSKFYTMRQESSTANLLPLVKQLLAEKLIVLADETDLPSAGAVPPPALTGGNFVPPVLRIYTDVEELLLVDPVHETSDSGWPDIPESPGA